MFHICHAAKQKTVPPSSESTIGLAAARAAVAGPDLTHNERNWFALYILVLIDRRQKRVILLSRRAGSLPELLERDLRCFSMRTSIQSMCRGRDRAAGRRRDESSSEPGRCGHRGGRRLRPVQGGERGSTAFN